MDGVDVESDSLAALVDESGDELLDEAAVSLLDGESETVVVLRGGIETVPAEPRAAGFSVGT